MRLNDPLEVVTTDDLSKVMDVLRKLLRIYTPFICTLVALIYGVLLLMDIEFANADYILSAVTGNSIIVVAYMWASEQMTNAHGDPAHHWGVEDVKSAFERLGFKKPEENTWGDVVYSANMHYADYYGTTLKTEAECVKQAYADVADPDGYPGKIFNRWCADVIGKKVNVPWENFI